MGYLRPLTREPALHLPVWPGLLPLFQNHVGDNALETTVRKFLDWVN